MSVGSYFHRLETLSIKERPNHFVQDVPRSTVYLYDATIRCVSLACLTIYGIIEERSEENDNDNSHSSFQCFLIEFQRVQRLHILEGLK